MELRCLGFIELRLLSADSGTMGTGVNIYAHFLIGVILILGLSVEAISGEYRKHSIHIRYTTDSGHVKETARRGIIAEISALSIQ